MIEMEEKSAREQWKDELTQLAFTIYQSQEKIDPLFAFHQARKWMKDKDEIAESFADTYMEKE